MKFYDEEKLLKLRNILIVTVLALLALLLFFRVYDNFAEPIRLVTSTIFPFILSFIIVYCLMPFIDMISEKDKNDSFLKNSKLDELEKVEKMNISDSEKRKKIELFNEISQSNKKKRIKLNRTFAILLVLTVFFIIFLYIVLTIVPIFTKQVSSLIDFLLKNQGKLQNNFFEFLERNNIDLKSSLISSKDIIVSNVIKVLSSSFSLISSTFSLLFMTPIFTIMLIFSYDNIENGVKRVLRNMDREDLIILIKNMDETIGKYILVTALDSMIVGVVSFIIFYFLKMDYSMLFSVIIGFGNVIPFIGPFIGLIPAILYAFTKSFKLVIFIVVLITIVQTIEANIVKPWLTGKSVEMHPITTLLVVLIGGALFGIGGAFIAIPVYIIVKLTFLFFWEKYTVNNKLNEKRKWKFMDNKGKMEIQKCIYFSISKMFRIVNKIAEESFEKIDIYPTHGFLMIILKEEENGLTVNQISETLAIAPSTVTRFVDKLIAKGYVKREKSGKNSITKITVEGLKIIPDIYKSWDGISEKIEEVIGNEEYLRKTGESFKEFADVLGKDKKYDKISEDFDFWII